MLIIDANMDSDTLACRQSDTMFIVWMRHLDRNKTEEMAARLAYKHLQREPIDAMAHSQGSFNRCYRVKFKQGPDVLVRFPALGRSMFRREKLEDEAAVMEYLRCKTSIPIPHVLGIGMSAVGPYMVTQFVEGKLLSDYLRASQDPKLPATLNFDLDMGILRKAYRAMANILLELSKCQFSEIGGLVWDNKRFSVKKRAMTFNMNELVSLGNFPPKRLSQGSFLDVKCYLLSLANDHLNHLETQRNDAIFDENDCRRKYIARCLFRSIVSQFSWTYDQGPFILYCDDLRPANVLVDPEFRVRGVIDWEYTYAAPAEFTYCSPWWLLLARPESWEGGIDAFLAQYMPRQRVFLEVLRDCEKEAGLESYDLSGHMSQSFENGNFWVFAAATYSFAFDDIYWPYIHQKYYGNVESIDDLTKLLSSEEQSNIEKFVDMKMQQKKEVKLDSHRSLQEMTDA